MSSYFWHTEWVGRTQNFDFDVDGEGMMGKLPRFI